MRILIDGDACPVVDSIIRLTSETGIFVYLFRTYDHFSVQSFPEHVEVKYVDGGRDAVDFMILQYAQPDDIVVTQDYDLASLLLNKVKYVLHHTGHLYTLENIERLLTQRYYHQQERRKSKRYPKGPKAFNQDQRLSFESQLLKLIETQQ
ncbi:YaiI/YqxD family protein [Staphylococcus coagulans]|uniref:YaiI/YqxD family protein n=1 Tax=Staphylococcus coagulans TaxID=74706 RepID=UPI001F4BD6B9|nr:YaiI/YqxD family protein [Staphylococcus coagulans]UNB45834.1 YaiI/YqxD family protein [Staphylococcus coagulans]